MLLLIIGVILLVGSTYQTSSGSVELDEISFHKVIKKFDAALVKFDVAFPYGEKHEAFVAIAKDASESDELLIAEVGVKDYGEKDNDALARKYGANKDNFPVVKLFRKGQSEPLTFDETKGFTSDELRSFVRENTGIYLNLPGCVKKLDMLAAKFMKASEDGKSGVLKEFEGIALKEKEISSGKIYKTIMEKVIEKSDSFIKTEYERVKKLLSGKISDEKKKELGIRINILQTFQYQLLDKNQNKKSEL